MCPARSPRAVPHVFTVPPGVPFLDTLVAALLEGRLVPGFNREVGPLALSGATIYLPSRRAARALAATIAGHLGTTAFLPRIRALGALEEDGLADDAVLDEDLAADHPVAVEPLQRRMILTRLILAWSESVRHALVGVDPDGRRDVAEYEAFLVATTAADAWHLAGELATLLDELIIEDVSWKRIEPLGTEAFDRYWAVTLDFLDIAVTQWPAILAERGWVDPTALQAKLIDWEIARFACPSHHPGPIIVAGATGSNAATARLMGAIARLPQGAVVLPGLDQGLDDAAWEAIDGTGFHAGSTAGHAQAGLKRLLPALGITRADVMELGVAPPRIAPRNRLVSEALRPADATDAWQRLAADPAALDAKAALDGIAVIEAADEREEAFALALALRETLEGPGAAILVTPDRTLARRVKEELTRWDIVIDDSGGEMLGQTGAGALARLALEAAHSDLAPVAVLALLNHPAVRLGRSRGEISRLTRLIELAILRSTLPAGALLDPPSVIAKARELVSGERPPRPLRNTPPERLDAAEALLEDLLAALEPLRRAARNLPEWVAAHDEAIAALTETEAGVTSLGGPDGHGLLNLLDELGEAADPAIGLDGRGYAALFDRIAGEEPVRGPERSHPRLKILGLIEARLLSADRILLGGLDETVWPPQVRTSPFLNRPMRATLGLTPPERRIGQTAHDFTIAMGQPEVIISRAAKRGGAPTVPSRFLQRLAALTGEAWDNCRMRGNRYLELARALDRPIRPIILSRPCPKPSVELRPTKLSVTRIETLRRDPYAIYADRILRLSPLDPIGAPVGPREWGTIFHDVIGTFTSEHPRGPLPEHAEAELLSRTEAAFAHLMVEPGFRAFMAPRLAGWVRGFVAWERERRAGLQVIAVESKGEWTLTLRDGSAFTLTAHADRLETSRAGAVSIIDFKTGRIPSKREVQVGFAPQLTLEAALAARGGFPALGAAAQVGEALYVGFGSDGGLSVTRLEWNDRSLPDVVDEHVTGLTALLSDFRRPDTGYLARPYPQFEARYSDYDHLSRVKEWSANGDDGSDT